MPRTSSKHVSYDLSQPLLPPPPTPPDYISNANLLSYLTFSFTSTLLRLGNTRVLNVNDVPPVPPSVQAEKVVAQFQEAWNYQKKTNPGGKLSIPRACFRCFWRDIVRTGVLAAFKGLGTVSGPVFLYFLVDYSSGNVRFEHEGVILVVALFVVKIVENFCQRHWYFGVRVLGSKVQAALTGAIYDKELRLSSEGRREHTTGEIINYVSVDGFRLCEFAWRLHWSWLVPVMLVASFGIVFTIIGLAAIPAAVLIVVILISLNPLIKSMQQSQMKFMVKQDERLRATSEVLMGMKVIKLQAWEEKFKDFILQMRNVELKWLADTQQKRTYATVLYWQTPIILTCAALISCVLLGTKLSATIVFSVLATFRIMQDPIRMAPEVLSSLIQVQVSFSRMEKFLQEDELPLEELLDTETSGKSVSDYQIRVDNAVLSWDPANSAPTLTGINMVVKRGEKVAVCGHVGSGKTSLLLSLLGEVPKLAGTVQLSGRVAYVPQTAWIQTMSLRDNILFGKPFDMVRYRNTLRACALEEDIKSFSHGDRTEIGERGVNMSGGQKQRIQLARAVYNDADIYLLDDPFSAVDAQTAAVLFHDCVMGELRDKTVVLVTHQIEFLPLVDTVLVMQDGEVKQAGTYDDLLTDGKVFEQLVTAHQQALHSVMGNGESEQGVKRGAKSEGGDDFHFEKLQRRLSREESLTDKGSESGHQLVQDEAVETGIVGVKPYWHYLQISRGLLFFLIIMLGQALFSVAQVFSNLWLANGVSTSEMSSQILISVYAALAVVCWIAFGVRSQLLVMLGTQASRVFFDGLMSRIMKAPMSFFDSTPSGRILNRASVDISTVDLDIPFSFGNALGTMFDVICVVVVTAIVTWETLVIMIPVLVFTRMIQRYYASAARELNRINSTTKAPIINNVAETINGCATIRAFKEVERFRRRNLELVDADACAYIYKFAALEWMIIRIEIGCTILLAITASLVLFQNTGVSSGYTGLAVTYALALNSSLVVFSIWQCFLGIYIVSVERIRQYMDLPTEAPAISATTRPPTGWPHRGKVAFQDLKIRYREFSPLVLKGITCTFHGGQKIGVVGRTGSGKTTLISALFRLVEPASGRICIDDIDIVSIGLHDLRFKLGIIPQDPVLFQGTVRTNLDPLNQYTDLEVWEALRKCQLVEFIERLTLQLDSPVSDQGENWSAGQRQLFCLGRVLLKQSQVLVLDEATASIDSATDGLLQSVLREEFSACTVITVAHRIPTVIDSDMVMALRDGRLIEFEPPKVLIENETSLFSQLVAEYWAQAGRNSASSDHLPNS